jgi:hypothetical protein
VRNVLAAEYESVNLASFSFSFLSYMEIEIQRALILLTGIGTQKMHRFIIHTNMCFIYHPDYANLEIKKKTN